MKSEESTVSLEDERLLSSTSTTNDMSLDLFHRVMKNGENYAYDGNIGQYVHVDTLKDRVVDSNGSVGNVSRDLNYLKFMKREKHEMTKIVEETIQRRNDEYIENVIDITHDTLKEWKAKIPCSLCEHPFPPSQLLGTISLNTLLNWRADHHYIPTEKQQQPSSKTSLLNKYQTVRLCVFCSQFFDDNFSHSLDVEMEANAEFKQHLKEQLTHKKSKPRDTPLSKLQVNLSIAELYNRKVGATIKPKVLEPLNSAAEVKRLEEENRRLQYLKAKKKFRDYKKRFQEDLEEWRGSDRSPATSRSQRSQMDSPGAATSPAAVAEITGVEEGTRVRSSPASGLTPSPSGPSLRSSSSAGLVNERVSKERISSSSLPQIPTASSSSSASSSSKRRESEKGKLQSVKESNHESSKELKRQQLSQRAQVRKPLLVPSVEKSSFLTALDDVVGDLGEGEDEEDEQERKGVGYEEIPMMEKGQAKGQEQSSVEGKKKRGNATEEPKRRKGKPEWVEVGSSDHFKRTSATGAAGEIQEKVSRKAQKIAKLVNSAKECYSQKPEDEERPHDTADSSSGNQKNQRKVDISFTKRRRNRLDPRNNIKQQQRGGGAGGKTGQSLKRKKKQQRSLELRQSTEKEQEQKEETRKLTREESEALRKIEESLKDSDSGTLAVSVAGVTMAPQRAVEILERHQTPNLAQVKKLTIGRRIQKSVPAAPAHAMFSVAKEIKKEQAEEVEDEAPISSEAAAERSKAKAESSEAGLQGGTEMALGTGEYEDEAFDSEGDSSPGEEEEGKPEGQTQVQGQEQAEDEDEDEDEYKDDDEFEEDLETSRSPVKAFGSSAKFLGGLRVSLPQEEEQLGEGQGEGQSSSSCRRLWSRERGGERTGEGDAVNGIELLSTSGLQQLQRIGSASSRSGSRKGSHRPKLPPFDNTDPLILCPPTASGDPPSALETKTRRSSRDGDKGLGKGPAATTAMTPSRKSSKPSALPSSGSIANSSSRKPTSSMNIPTNFKFIPQPVLSTATAASAVATSGNRRSSAPQLCTSENQQLEASVVNLDSKAHQRMMGSDKSTGMRMAVMAAGGVQNIATEEGGPTLLDMTILKQSGQVRRAIKREDSFDKLTRKIARTLRQQSSM